MFPEDREIPQQCKDDPHAINAVVVTEDRSFPFWRLNKVGGTAPQQCEEDPYGVNAIVVTEDGSLPFWGHHLFQNVFLDHRLVPEVWHDGTINQNQDVDAPQYPVPHRLSITTALPMRTNAGDLAAALPRRDPTNGVDSLDVCMETDSSSEEDMKSVKEEDKDGQQKRRHKKGKKKCKKGQRCN